MLIFLDHGPNFLKSNHHIYPYFIFQRSLFVKLHPHSLHLYLCIPLILPFLTYLLLLHFLHSVFIFLFSLLLAIFILASYLSYGNTPIF
ncbi:hypothetical protein Bandiella_00029 [Candidatus Bandiella woodruffii]|uniref:Uncharacterized protein n=1 Tax=Candidatus Bandiella euplotis TaxID=1664265 RepID=A0ABZ0UJP5_9RICK|nr:hypothetical protein Bandiella_00029 [Candidatus Bandiella woodruffii]